MYIKTLLNTAFTAKYASPEKYHAYVMSRGRNKLAAHIAELVRTNVSATPATALDLGAGTGIITEALQRAGFTVTATDADPAMLKTLKKQQPQTHVQVVDINQPFGLPGNTFNAITTVWANRYITRAGFVTFVPEVLRVLKPGGVFVWPLFDADHVLWKLRAGMAQPTSVKALTKQLLAAGFSSVQVNRSYRRKNRAAKEIPNWTYPVYLIAKK